MKKYPKKPMSAPWQVQTAKAKFSEVFRRARNEGPQLIVKQGNEAVVMIPAEQFEALVASSSDKYRTLVEFFSNSPLVGLELDLTREKDSGRDIEL